jgi:hypothetical protein
MDTKKLYIKSQKTVLNWGLGLATAFFIMTILGFFSKNYAFNKLSIILPTAVYTFMFVLSLVNRIKINKKAALIALAAYALFSVYLIIEMIVKAKKTYATLSLTFPTAPLAFTIFSYMVGVGFILGMNFLYYKVYKSTERIQILENSDN